MSFQSLVFSNDILTTFSNELDKRISNIFEEFIKVCNKDNLISEKLVRDTWNQTLEENVKIIKQSMLETEIKKKNLKEKINKQLENKKLPQCFYVSLKNNKQCTDYGKVGVDGKFYCKSHLEYANIKHRCEFIMPEGTKKAGSCCGTAIKHENSSELDFAYQNNNYLGKYLCKLHSSQLERGYKKQLELTKKLEENKQLENSNVSEHEQQNITE